MRLRDYIILTLTIAGFAFAFSAFNSPQMAQAYLHSTPPIDDSSFEAELTALLDGGAASGGTTPPIPGSVASDFFLGAQFAGRYPWIMKSFVTLSVASQGFDIGWKIGRIIDTKWLHLEGNLGTAATNATVSSTNWCLYGSSGCGSAGALTNTTYGLTPQGSVSPTAPPDAVFDMVFSSPCVMSGATVSQIGQVFDPAGYVGGGGMPACMTNAWNAFNAYIPSPTATVHLESIPNSDCITDANVIFGVGNWTTAAGTGCYQRVMHERDVVPALVHTPPAPYGSQPAGTTTTLPTTSCGGAGQQMCAPAGAITDLQWSAAKTQIELNPFDTDWANCMLAPADFLCPDGSTIPGFTPAPAFTIPQPTPLETYDEYTARLRALGYLGAIVALDDTGFDPLGSNPYPAGSPALDSPPGTVTGVGLTTPLIIPLFWPFGSPSAGQPKPWPSAAGAVPTITPATTTTITVRRVPATYNPPSGGGGTSPPGEPPPPTGTGSCKLPTIPSVDFTPLTGMTFGDKFPFGVFSMLSTVVGYFNVTPVAPSVDMNMSGLSTFVPGFSAHYTFNLSYFSTYMGTIRTIMAFALWLGALWYVGTALLGFRAGGDVSESADDGFTE